jgi:dihydroorotate dehydrogenase
MPDWTYHPFFKPLLFRLPAEQSRRVTLSLLAIQARTSIGRRIFRLFGHGQPPDSVAVRAFGLRFPSPIGIAQGIDTEAIAVSVLQYLGPGFLVVGPVSLTPRERRLEIDPVRIREHCSIASSRTPASLGAAAIAARLKSAPELGLPVGVALAGDDLTGALRASEEAAAFFILPASCAGDEATLLSARGATKKPILLRIPPHLDDDRLDEITDRAVRVGIDGCIAVAGHPCSMLPEGELTGPFLHARALDVIARIARRHGDKFPVIGSGGIMSPDDALAAMGAGATLVELYEGLVYAGPGLPGRILHALEDREEAPEKAPPAPAKTDEFEANLALRERLTANLPALSLAFTGAVLVGAGVIALGLAATIKLLPYDIHYLGMTVDELCKRNGCRIVHFMAHDRVSFGGAIISIGILYVWLALVPLREGRAWAWWTLALSGVVGFASFLTYLGYGYLDLSHGIATLLLLPFYIGGILFSRTRLRGPRGISTLGQTGARAWFYSPAGLGRAAVTFAAVGMILGGATIMSVGVTRVFVPQDLEYMDITVAELNALNPRLVPLIAHDRAGFGGGLFSGGITVLFSLWCGARPGARARWVALFAAGIIGFACAIGIHPIVGYTSFVHLAPAYAGAAAFLVGMILLYRPMWHGDRTRNNGGFPDL